MQARPRKWEITAEAAERRRRVRREDLLGGPLRPPLCALCGYVPFPLCYDPRMSRLALLLILALAPQWTWTDKDGRARNAEDLKAVLHQHALWLESGGRQGSRANLRLAELHGADLSQARLGRAVLGVADLSRADLRGADLSRANLWMTRLPSAKLAGADLSGAMMVDAVLSEADLSGVRLTAANLRRTTLSGASLKDADLRFANLAFAAGIRPEQLQQAKGWREAYYDEDMLRELGLPEEHNRELEQRHREEDPESHRRLFGR